MNTFTELGRKELKELLAECTDAEVNMFNRMYISVDEIPLDKIDWAIQQIERTLEKRK